MDENFLSSPQPPDIADLEPGEAEALLKAAPNKGFAVFRLDGAAMRDKEALMTHAAAALAFPGDFGRNWDAMIDYLGDMATVHKKDRILIYVDGSGAMAAAAPGLYKDLRETCACACDNARQWSRGRVILKFVFAA